VDDELVELVDVAAFATAPPPTAAAAMAAPVTSMDLMLRIWPPVDVVDNDHDDGRMK
jgi:hypothetical protein